MGTQFFDSLKAVLSEDKIAQFFLVYMSVVLFLNMIKAIILWREREKETINNPCEYLSNDGEDQICKNASYAETFKKRNNSCKGCFGRSINQSKESVERRAKKSGAIAFLIILLADIGRVVLPYAAILFTLLSKISTTQP